MIIISYYLKRNTMGILGKVYIMNSTILWKALEDKYNDAVQLLLDHPKIDVLKGKTMDFHGILDLKNLLFSDKNVVHKCTI